MVYIKQLFLQKETYEIFKTNWGVLIYSKARSESRKNRDDESHAWHESTFFVDVYCRLVSNAIQISNHSLFQKISEISK